METNFKQHPHPELIKIVCYGPESTGKTTLTMALADHYNTRWVPEYMRTYFEEKWKGKKGTSAKEDIVPIAKGQMEYENTLSRKAQKILFCDTNLLQIKVYSQVYFNEYCPGEVEKFASENQYDLYFLMAIDVPWEADNMRDKPEDRAYMFDRFEKELIKQNKNYRVLTGNYSRRLETSINHIDQYLNSLR